MAVIYDPASGGFISIAQENIGPIKLKKKTTFVSGSGGRSSSSGGGGSQSQSTLETPTKGALSDAELERRAIIEEGKQESRTDVVLIEQRRQELINAGYIRGRDEVIRTESLTPVQRTPNLYSGNTRPKKLPKEGGSAFLLPSESGGAREVSGKDLSQEEKLNIKSITQAEKIVGVKEGTSGVTFVEIKDPKKISIKQAGEISGVTEKVSNFLRGATSGLDKSAISVPFYQSKATRGQVFSAGIIGVEYSSEKISRAIYFQERGGRKFREQYNLPSTKDFISLETRQEGRRAGIIAGAFATPILGESLAVSSFSRGRELTKYPETRFEGLVEAGASGVFLGASGIGRAGKFLRQEITTYTPTRQPKITKFTQEAVELSVGGKSSKFLTVERVGELRPPILKETTSNIRNILGKGPISSEVLPAQQFKQVSLNLGTGGKGVNPSSFVLGEIRSTQPNVQRLYLIKGGSKEVDVVGGQFTKVERGLLQQLAPFKESSVVVRGRTEVFNLGKINRKNFRVDIAGGGRTTSSQLSFGKLDKIAVAKEGDLFAVATASKDTSRPFFKASGKIQSSEGLFLERKPLSFGGGESFGVSPKGITKTPLSKTFQLQQTKNVVAVALPPAPKTSIPKTKVTQIPKNEFYPQSFGSSGQYQERIQQSNILFQPQTQPSVQSFSQLSFQGTRQMQFLGSVPASATKSNLSQETFLGQRTRQELRLENVQVQRQESKLKFSPVLKQQPKLSPIITPISSSRPVYYKPQGSFGGRIKPPKLKPSRGTRGGGTYTVSIRRGGVFRPIGTGLSGPRAVSVGQARVSSTLGATFKLTPERGTPSTNIKTPRGYKRKNGLTFVEAPKFRLSTRSETKEIQSAKRRKK